jgi:3-hydroxymyristoyl/3-hydroxydecanoyl-(acyl carrier protein) dehydratase
MSVYTAKEIMEIIPHRHPFMLIDTIEELSTNLILQVIFQETLLCQGYSS